MPQSPRGIEYCAELERSRLDGSLPFPVSRHLGTVYAWHKPTSVLVVNLSHHLPTRSLVIQRLGLAALWR
jgi:hypothetical protein